MCSGKFDYLQFFAIDTGPKREEKDGLERLTELERFVDRAAMILSPPLTTA
jgi:hypothetical protein